MAVSVSVKLEITTPAGTMSYGAESPGRFVFAPLLQVVNAAIQANSGEIPAITAAFKLIADALAVVGQPDERVTTDDPPRRYADGPCEGCGSPGPDGEACG